MKSCAVIVIMSLAAMFSTPAFSEVIAEVDKSFEKAKDHEAMIPAEITWKIELPEGYHEGLLFEGGNVWVNNGRGGKTWVVNLDSGEVISEIEPVGTFSEGITAAPGGKYWITDWDAKKLYLVRVEGNKMVPESEISLGPSHPTGVIWNGSNLYVITWTRGVGTTYDLLKMDSAGNLISKVRIKGIQEPSQLAWDGKDLWISSWFQRRVYKIDAETLRIKGYFRSRVENTTGITWDGTQFWLTGTKADLYRVEISQPEE